MWRRLVDGVGGGVGAVLVTTVVDSIILARKMYMDTTRFSSNTSTFSSKAKDMDTLTDALTGRARRRARRFITGRRRTTRVHRRQEMRGTRGTSRGTRRRGATTLRDVRRAIRSAGGGVTRRTRTGHLTGERRIMGFTLRFRKGPCICNKADLAGNTSYSKFMVSMFTGFNCDLPHITTTRYRTSAGGSVDRLRPKSLMFCKDKCISRITLCVNSNGVVRTDNTTAKVGVSGCSCRRPTTINAFVR